VPEKAKIDALHIAVASVHGMDYLVSWKCTHVANAGMRGRIEAIWVGRTTPVLQLKRGGRGG
jgi:hypothetical protein